ncbi:protein-L-isoaspartate O-methyltransferase family protein [Glycomyces paridis]|nr:hypothetical protein [Glycomyces paridis]
MHDHCVQERYVAALHASGSMVRARTVQAVEAVHVCDFGGSGLDPATGQVPPERSVRIEMIDLLDPRPGMRVLEIGTGSGYTGALIHTAVGDRGHLETVAYKPATAPRPDRANLRHVTADGLAYEPRPADFDRVVVWPALARVPMRLCDALRPGGRMLCTLDRPDLQLTVEIERTDTALSVAPVKIVAQRAAPALGDHAELAVSTATEAESTLTEPWPDGPGGRVVDFWGWLINQGVPALLRLEPGPEVMRLDVGDGQDWARLRVAGRELRGTATGIARLRDRFGDWCAAGRPHLADNPVPWTVAASPAGESLTPAWASLAYRQAEAA